MELLIRHEGVDHKAEAQMLKNTLWVHFQGRTFAVDKQIPGRRSRKGSAVESDRVLAPMPGKITKILVVADQEVEKGQAVLVMEAMKMEYTLKAEVAGRIAIIQCQTGDQVILGKMLVKIEPTKS